MNDNNVAALAIAVQAHVPVLLIGEPGTGKTKGVEAVGRALGLETAVFIGACRTPEDIGGYPVPDMERRRVSLLPVGEWIQPVLDKGEGIVFLDEMSCNTGAMQAALLRVAWEKVFGDVRLPAKASIVGAMNPPELAAGGYDIAAPLANRMVHIPWSVDPQAAIQGFLDDWPVPSVPIVPGGWEKEMTGVKVLMASFFKRFPTAIQRCPTEESKRSEAWPSMRSWYGMAIPLLAAAKAAHVSDDVEAILLSGAVGSGEAIKFLAWARELDLPDPEALLKNPKEFVIGDRLDKTFATLNSVVAAAISNLTAPRWGAAWKILSACAKAGHVDVAAAAARSLAKARRGDLPIVPEEIKPFAPLLQAAKVM